ncbi:type III toxin-antitoxin system TenpIN family toxin [Morganella psychrotolerans]|uniref:type III toxin-antitoxin system TenpIN family toxin n=1 Tax=Morganella psychrotolerans TaxID=368603 RepID=UPI0039AF2204
MPERNIAMKLLKLDSSFYEDNPVIREALDFDAKTLSWGRSDNKRRGHGIVKITLSNLVFAIPVRSNIRHNDCFIIEIDHSESDGRGMGLDYTKAMLIRDITHISDEPFLLKNKVSGKKLLGKEEHIEKQFSKYIDRYIAAVLKCDENILRRYRFATLINYHPELGLNR